MIFFFMLRQSSFHGLDAEFAAKDVYKGLFLLGSLGLLGALLYDHAGYDDVVDGAVVLVGGYFLYLLGNVHAFDDVAVDGVFAVEVGRAAVLLVVFEHLRRHLIAFGFLLGAYFAEAGRAELLARDDVELGPATALLGVDIVGLACSCQGTACVVVVGQEELGCQAVGHVAVAQHLAGFCRAAVGVASLYHELVDDAMEEGAVVVAALGQLEEVVAVDGGLVEEGYADVTHGCLDAYDAALVLLLGADGNAKQG